MGGQQAWWGSKQGGAASIGGGAASMGGGSQHGGTASMGSLQSTACIADAGFTNDVQSSKIITHMCAKNTHSAHSLIKKLSLQ